MQYQFLLITVFILFGCGRHQPPKSLNSVKSTSDSVAIRESQISADNDMDKARVKVPPGISLDSLTLLDSSRYLRIEIVLPKSKDQKLRSAEKLLGKIISKEKESFTNSLDRMMADDPELRLSTLGSEFLVYPVELYKDENLLSYLFAIEVYHVGAPHPKLEYYTFNYDISKQKQIKFSDYFVFTSSIDEDALIQSIKRSFNNHYLFPEKIYDFDFNFNTDSPTFNFDNYEIAGYSDGAPRASFNKSELSKYIRESIKH
jgi:hypothetical protein